ncbi:MAG: ATP-binding cassette domain-containing protein [Anaerolineae bacterium]|nr:ATP-binding cassette domain-containing protein [Anaerolineae bacterium]
MIKTEGLTKRFGDILAVDGLILHVERGEVFAFLGPNGAGKTTTVRMLAALIASTAGRAWVNGHEIGKDDMNVRRSVGILTEAPGLYERLDAVQNLTLYAKLYEVDDVAGQVEKYLRLLGLWERRDEPVGGFSKGMKQKLAIARALLHEPPLLFLDEPTAALDPEAARTVRDFISEVKEAGRTIFLCTHNLDEADRLADRIGVIKQKLIQVDSPANLRRSLYGRRVVIHLVSVTEPVRDAVRGLPFVKEMQQVDNTLLVSLDNPEEQNPILVERIVTAGGAVQFVNEVRHSLEDVYFSLIEEGEQEAA